ncbi:Ig-like domain-containing protein, partial [Pseudohongiella sp. O18]|uniref:Ig-like domain-containing protein n=1 Tax=Pseudohongiella sp. O18 TaxID=2904248 RepID=UPI001F4643C0
MPAKDRSASKPTQTTSTTKRRKQHSTYENSLLALEPRMLLDAALATTVVDAPSDDATVETMFVEDIEQQAHSAFLDNNDSDWSPAAVSSNADDEGESLPTPAPEATLNLERFAQTLALNARREVVFVDASLPDYQVLLQAAKPGLDVVLLDPNTDGLEQIANWLSENGRMDAIHVLAHGDASSKHFGSTVVTTENIGEYAELLNEIGQSLTEDADILLYGCRVAEAEGSFFVDEFARLTGADVAASTDVTANPEHGGNWLLEYANGTIESELPFERNALQAFSTQLDAQVNLAGKDSWVPIMGGDNFDPQGDSQSGAADLDLIGATSHPVLYAAYDDNGTPDNADDDTLAFRVRIDNPASQSDVGRVILIGMDANNDGRVDIFMSVDARNNSRAVRLMDPGTGLNNSPNTTTTSVLPPGWLPNNGVYSLNSSNFSVVSVSSSTDPNWDGTTDRGNDGNNDVFVSFRIPMKDLTTVLAIGSPTDRKGEVGPRGTSGISGFNKDTSVKYVLMSQTQPGPINGDLAGVGSKYNKNATFDDLGAYTPPMTPDEPVASGLSVSVTTVGDGNISLSESQALDITGKTGSNVTDGTWVKVTVTSSGGGSVDPFFVQVSNKTWSLDDVNISALNNGTLTVTSQLWTTGNDSGSQVSGSTTGTLTATLDKTAPSVTVNSIATVGTPTISGTSDLPVGSQITVVIDPDNNSSTDNSLTYVTTVLSGGTWSIPISTATPTSGTLSSSGLTRFAKITASGTDAAGNTGSATGQNVPTVNSQTTVDKTPTVTGTWTNISGDTLSVVINNVTYTSGSGLTISGNTWTATVSGALDAGTYQVVATVTRDSTNVSDATAGELVVVDGQQVSITSSATANLPKPTISGTSTVNNGSIIVRVDPGNDGTGYVTYSVSTDASGNWSLNLATATPLSGSLPSTGLESTNGIRASYTDDNGTVIAEQTLTVVLPTMSSIGIETAVTQATTAAKLITGDGFLNSLESSNVVVSGTTTNVANGSNLILTITDSNNNVVTRTVQVNNNSWSVTIANDVQSLSNGTLTVKGALDGTTVTRTTTTTLDKIAPYISNTTQSPIRASSGAVIKGITDLPQNTVLTVELYTASNYSGNPVQTLSATVQANGSWSAETTSNLSNNSTVYVRVKAPANTSDTAGNLVQNLDFNRPVANSIGNSTRVIDVKPITGDNVVSSNEISGGLTISGETNGTSQTVTVTITQNGSTVYTKTTTAGSSYTAGTNNWSVTLTKAEVQALSNGQFQVTATVTEGSGNSQVTVTDAELATLNLDSPVLTITDNVSGVASGDVTFTFTFDQAMKTGEFTASDINVTNGTKGTFTAVSSTVYTLVVTPTANSTGNITVSVGAGAATSDVTGRNNLAASATQAFDTANDITAPSLDFTIDNQAVTAFPVISGTTSLAAGATVDITIDPNGDGNLTDQVVYSATVKAGNPSNTWSVDLSAATPDSGTAPDSGYTGSSIISVKAENQYGNSTTLKGSVLRSISNDSGNSSTDFLTNDQTLIFSGYAQPGSSVALTLGSTSLATVTADGSTGIWTYNYTGTTLAAGNYELKAVSTVDGNTATSTQDIVIDTTAPSVAISSITTDSGTAADFKTNDNQLVFNGTATANSAVTVTLSGSSGQVFSVNTTASSEGNWSVDRSALTALADGSYTLTAATSDRAGNSAQATQTIVIDTTAAISITSSYISRDTTPTISGSSDLETGRTITVTVDGTQYTTTVQAGGFWSVEATTPVSGEITVSASGTDEAGNSASTSKAMVIDTSAPDIAIGTVAGDDTITSEENGSVVISGTTTDVSNNRTVYVTITDGTTTIVDDTTVSNNAWSLDALNLKSMKAGTLTITATYYDDQGNAYVATRSVTHTKTGVSIDSISDDTGTAFDYITSDRTLTFNGTTGANDTVTLSLSGPSGTFSNVTVTANSSGVWTYNHTGTSLSDGTYTLTAVSNGDTKQQQIVVDGTAPTGPVTVNSQTVLDVTPTITGTATVGSGEELTVDVNGVRYTVGDGHLTLSGSNWTLQIPDANALSAGRAGTDFVGYYEVTAAIRDTAGNVLNDSTTNELLIQDATAPVVDLNGSGDGANHSATSSNGARTSLDSSNSATVTEASDKIQKVSVTVSGLQNGDSEKLILGSTTFNANGTSGNQSSITVDNVTYSVSYNGGASRFDIFRADAEPMSASQAQSIIRALDYQNTSGNSSTTGARTFTITAIDDAGNTSSSVTSTITVSLGDTTPPAKPVVSSISTDTGTNTSDGITSDQTLTFSGTAEANSTVEVFIDGTSIGTTTANGSGNWSFNHEGTTLAEGSYTVTAKATDAANNVSDPSDNYSLVIDITAPAKPAVTAISTDTAGTSTSDGITSDQTLVFSGTAAANSTVEVFIGGNSIGTTTANGSGNWSFDHTGTTLAEGSYTVTARA